MVGTGRFELPQARLRLAPSQFYIRLRAIALRRIGVLAVGPKNRKAAEGPHLLH
jgi:hypothetical protein